MGFGVVVDRKVLIRAGGVGGCFGQARFKHFDFAVVDWIDAGLSTLIVLQDIVLDLWESATCAAFFFQVLLDERVLHDEASSQSQESQKEDKRCPHYSTRN